jgi:low temperature requirement protein LtrA
MRSDREEIFLAAVVFIIWLFWVWAHPTCPVRIEEKQEKSQEPLCHCEVRK